MFINFATDRAIFCIGIVSYPIRSFLLTTGTGEPTFYSQISNQGLQLVPEIQALDSLETLEAVLKAIKKVKTLDELRQVYGP